MIPFFIFSHFVFKAWDDYWNDNQNPTPITHYDIASDFHLVFSTSDSSVYIYNSFFQDCFCSEYTNGGAIYYHGSSTKFLVERSTFIACKTTGSNGGGAIYFCQGEYIFSKVCGIKCYADPQGIFSYCNTLLSSYSGKILDSTIYMCNSDEERTIFHSYGYFESKSLNVSYNTCARGSGMYIGNCHKNCSIRFASFSNNTSTESK